MAELIALGRKGVGELVVLQKEFETL
jgi:hypothetical protein